MNQPDETLMPSIDISNRLSRLHWSSVLFDVFSQVRALIFPAILMLLGAARGDNIWLIIGGVAIVPTLIFSIIRYLTFSFRIQNGQLIIQHGLIFRNVRSVPVERIQNIDFVQNPLHRVVGVAEVRVETASGSEPEATLRVLKTEQVENLRAEIFRSRSENSSSAKVVGANPGEGVLPAPELMELSDAEEESSSSTVLSIPSSWLIYAGLASNRGALLIGVFFAFMYEARAFIKRIDFQRLRQWLPSDWGVAMTVVAAVLGFLVFLIFLRILGIIWYQLRFHGYQLSRKGDDLRISCGLFTKVQATVPRRRIQFISVQRNLIMRLLGFSSVRIETASSGGNHDDATKSVSSRWFIPIVPNNQLPALMDQIRPGLLWNEDAFNLRPVSPRAAKRAGRLAYLVAIVLSGGGLIYTQPWGFLLGLIVLPPLLWVIRKGVGALRFGRTSDGVVFRSGLFTVKTSMTFFEKIQSLELQQSPFDRRWRMAKLSLDTAAAGPAEHLIHIPYLDESIALEEQETIKKFAAIHQPVFG